ncbi:hypothetical protein CXB51_000827 [Gossypium anomalum]|uniref:Protein FAR1-RELATED SEQUENCE n=1 Tax=Gossypium anomalum TaxID=47600 RepID=A0A8J6DD26_9ROSI|nr:hypothetical protein CXB51_000827 [Gossypium anomalum]
MTEPIRQHEFLCLKSGYHKYEDIGKKTRTGCQAKIRFTIEKGLWIVSYFNDYHNYHLTTSKERINLRSGRKILEGHVDVIHSMVAAGIKQTSSYSFLKKEIGKKMIEAGEHYHFFSNIRKLRPYVFPSMHVDQNNRLANFFWIDERSKLDYNCFGDVLVFDTHIEPIKSTITGILFCSVVFSLSDETTESFTWLFETFLEAPGHRQPKSTFTNQDQAMMKAIEVVLPKSSHRLCTWHISNNAKQHLASSFANAEFKAQFNKCFCVCESEKKIESSWDTMIENFEIQDHTWLKRL